jgi:hypothetical protein
MMQTQQSNSAVEIEAVQRKAYELWVQGGCREGVAEQNWKEAERLVRATQAQRAEPSAPASEPSSAHRAPSSPPAAQTNNKKAMKRH